MRALTPLQRVHVSGPSMVPTLHDGDTALVWIGAAIHPGDVVLAHFRSMPGTPVLKRASVPAQGGWLLRSDNPHAGGDSAAHGIADVAGRVLVRWTRARGALGRPWPRRVRRADFGESANVPPPPDAVTDS